MSGTGSCGPPVKKIKKSEQTTIDFAFGKSKRKKDEGKLFTISICTVNSPGLLKLFSPGSTFTQFPDLRGPAVHGLFQLLSFIFTSLVPTAWQWYSQEVEVGEDS